MKRQRQQLIDAYEKLAYAEGECDAWEDDIEPRLMHMTTDEIYRWYKEDKQHWQARRKRLQDEGAL